VSLFAVGSLLMAWYTSDSPIHLSLFSIQNIHVHVVSGFIQQYGKILRMRNLTNIFRKKKSLECNYTFVSKSKKGWIIQTKDNILCKNLKINYLT
jgi:ABC-type Fe2+-enterobactin transport system substrate-binding protein